MKNKKFNSTGLNQLFGVRSVCKLEKRSPRNKYVKVSSPKIDIINSVKYEER